MDNIFAKLKQKVTRVKDIQMPVTKTVEQQAGDVMAQLQGMSRAYRRNFLRKYHLKIAGSAKPVINNTKKK